MQKPRIIFYSVLGTSGTFSCSTGVSDVETLGFSSTLGTSIFLIKDLACLTDKTARLKQVRKNKMESIVVVRVRNALVFVPNIDSTPEKLSTKPLPRPL